MLITGNQYEVRNKTTCLPNVSVEVDKHANTSWSEIFIPKILISQCKAALLSWLCNAETDNFDDSYHVAMNIIKSKAILTSGKRLEQCKAEFDLTQLTLCQ